MKYPTLEAVHNAQDANDFECLKCWHNELPMARTGEQFHILHEIDSALIALGHLDEEEITARDVASEWERIHQLELGGEA